MTKRVEFIVSFDLPPGASVAEAMAYVHGEVYAGCGGLHPDEPMFELNGASVQVQRVRQNADT